MKMTFDEYWAERDGKRLRVQYIEELRDEILKVYQNAGYTISIVRSTWNTEDVPEKYLN